MLTQNTPQIFEIFHLTPQKNCRDQRKLTIITPRNCFQATPQKIELSMAITQMSKFKHETDDYGTFQSIPATSSRLLCLLSVHRSAFVPKIMCICDEKLYPTELYIQTRGTGFLFICIFQMIIELLEHITIVSMLLFTRCTHTDFYLCICAPHTCLRANQAQKIFRAHDKLSSLVPHCTSSFAMQKLKSIC